MTKTKSTGKSKAGDGLLEAVRDMKARRAARVYVPDGKGRMVRSEVARARLLSGLTQQKFASLLGVSLRGTSGFTVRLRRDRESWVDARFGRDGGLR